MGSFTLEKLSSHFARRQKKHYAVADECKACALLLFKVLHIVFKTVRLSFVLRHEYNNTLYFVMGDIFVVSSMRNIQIMIVVSEVDIILLASNCVRVDTYSMLLVSGYKSAPDMHLVVVNHECWLVVLHFSLLAVVFSFSVAFWSRFGDLRVSLLLHLLEEVNDLCALLWCFSCINLRSRLNLRIFLFLFYRLWLFLFNRYSNRCCWYWWRWWSWSQRLYKLHQGDLNLRWLSYLLWESRSRLHRQGWRLHRTFLHNHCLDYVLHVLWVRFL